MLLSESEVAMESRRNGGNPEQLSWEQVVTLFAGGKGQNQTGTCQDIYTSLDLLLMPP